MIFFLFLISIPAFAQDDVTDSHRVNYRLAMQYYDQGLYENAVTEFYRSIFFDMEKENSDSSVYMIGMCERQMGNWTKSNAAFEKATVLTTNDQLKEAVVLAQASNLMVMGSLPSAELKLIRLAHTSGDQTVVKEAEQLLFITVILQNNWSRAQDVLNNSRYLKSGNSTFSSKATQILDQVNQHKPKSAKKAKMLSTLLPGTGQLYAKDYRNAANAFVLNAVNVTLTAVLLSNGYYVDGILYFMTLTERYFSGNRYQAEQIVRQKEQAYDESVQKKILELIWRTDHCAQ